MKIKTYEDYLAEDVHAGVYSGIPNAEYHAHPAIGRSDLEKIAQSPLHWKYYKENPKDPTPAMILGSALHELFLTPDDDMVAIAPDINKRTNAGKEEWADFQEANKGKLVIDDKQAQIAQGMVKSCYSNPEIDAAFQGCIEELTVFAVVGGIQCKARPDAWHIEGDRALGIKPHTLFDLKSCASAKLDAFINAIFDKGYHRQASFYFNIIEAAIGTRPSEFKFWAVENTPPHATNTIVMDPEFINMGDSDLYTAFVSYVTARETDTWKGHKGGYENAAPKTWMFYKYEANE